MNTWRHKKPAVSLARLPIVMMVIFGSCVLATGAQSARAFFAADAAATSGVLGQRAAYKKLLADVKRANVVDFDRRRAALDDYPLAPYLDYAYLTARLAVVSGAEVRSFVDANADNPLGVRLLGRYLSRAGKARRWGDYLSAATREPRSESLRCYYGRALRARGKQEDAWRVAERLWLSGSSVDDACDPLFRLWKEAGELTEALLWKRATLAYAAREGGLLRYLTSLAPAQSQEDFQALLRSYAQPRQTPDLAKALNSARSPEVMTLGFERFARYHPERALSQWQATDRTRLTEAQRARVVRALAYRGLLDRAEVMLAWIDAGLGSWGDDKLIEMRLRWAISDGDFASLPQTIEHLSRAAQNKGVWRYWLAHALDLAGEGAAAEALLARAAKQRSYYGFLSADRLGLAYSFEDDSLLLASVGAAETSRNVAGLPADIRATMWRVHELSALDENRLAHAEWTQMLRGLKPAQMLEVGRIAHDQQWYRFAIDAANAARANDALDLRFPLAYTSIFRERAKDRGVPESALMAIARRESAFLPSARSGVGARGLMQLMPSTGIAVARKAGLKLRANDLYNIDHNVELGSSYYRQLLDRFGDRRPVALAAYNAGPNRVQHWVGKDLPIDAWIETIPYRETRDYVKAVLAYSVIFDYRMGQQTQLMSPSETRSRY